MKDSTISCDLCGLFHQWQALPVGEFDPVAMLATLAGHGVRFVVVGGIGARLRGAPLVTDDVDITPAGDESNLENLAAALRVLNARLRTADDPAGLKFPIVASVLATSETWTLVTDSGDLDLVFRPDGTDGFDDLSGSASTLSITADGTVRVEVAALADIIRSKEAAGREKDIAVLPLLRLTLEESTDP